MFKRLKIFGLRLCVLRFCTLLKRRLTYSKPKKIYRLTAEDKASLYSKEFYKFAREGFEHENLYYGEVFRMGLRETIIRIVQRKADTKKQKIDASISSRVASLTLDEVIKALRRKRR